MELTLSLDDCFNLNRNAATRLVVRLCQLVLRITFRFLFRLKFIGIESLPKDRAFLLCPNHQSYLDPFFFYAMLPPELLERTLFVGDGGYFSRRSLSWMNRFGRIILTGKSGRKAACLDLTCDGLKRNMVVCIFPEGGRSKTGSVMPPFRGIGILACKANVPVIPVRIEGAMNVLSHLRKGIHFSRISMTVGSAIYPKQHCGYQEILNQWEAAIRTKQISVSPPGRRDGMVSVEIQEIRKQEFESIGSQTFDVTIIGGGVNGAALYSQLCRAGYRVLLVEQNDFASGTSQASAMMIWGGLLYLKNLDFASVMKLCASRERMIHQMQDWVKPQTFRYISSEQSRNSQVVSVALYLYWAMGGFKRAMPGAEEDFPERAFLKPDRFPKALQYEEGCVRPSDARYVLNWILSHRNENQIALNHCTIHSGEFNEQNRLWHLELRDALQRQEQLVHSKLVINAAGVWADSVNQRFKIDSPYKHVFSKGVFLGIRRNEQHHLPLILDTGSNGDCMSLIPWGPISLWGPTETPIQNLNEGFYATSADVEELVAELNRVLQTPVSAADVISLRCGVRPLAVKKSFSRKCYPLELSRRSRIAHDPARSWITLYGGKLTDCHSFAESVLDLTRTLIPEPDERATAAQNSLDPEWIAFPGIQERVVDPLWSRKNELCWTLEDYLRRRTNISQWTPRGGFGLKNENLDELKSLCCIFSDRDEFQATQMLLSYEQKIRREFDAPLIGGERCTLTA